MKQERIKAADFIAMQKGEAKGAARKNKSVEGDLSKTIAADLSLRLRVPNDRLQSGKLKIIKESVTTKGEKRRYENWMQFCEQGTPDRFFVQGFIVFLEIKQPGETSSSEQIAKQNELRSAGALVFEIDSFEKYEKVVAVLSSYFLQISDVKRLAKEIGEKVEHLFCK
jgi:hypothetical protein